MYKHLILILLLASISVAAAPEWVKKGVAVTYKVGASTIVFEVTERTATTLKVSLKVDGKNSGFPFNNVSGGSGSFWYDNTETKVASYSSRIDGWEVMQKDATVNAAGKDWTTIKVQKTEGGTKKDRYVDKETGLLIREESTVQTVVLESIVPSFDTPPVPPVSAPPQNPQGTPPPTAPPAETPTTTEPNEEDKTPPAGQSFEPEPVPTANPAPLTDVEDIRPPDSNTPCCPLGVFLFVSLLVFAYKAR